MAISRWPSIVKAVPLQHRQGVIIRSTHCAGAERHRGQLDLMLSHTTRKFAFKPYIAHA